MKKPTYQEIARRATVGTATVERVLNGRGGVRPEMVERVLLAARALDWPGRLPNQHRGVMRIEVMLVRPESAFFARLSQAFHRIAAGLDPMLQIQVTFVDEAKPGDIAIRISDQSVRRSALVISAPDEHRIRGEIEKARRAGLPVVQVVTEISPHAPIVGIDNYAAGRMAGLMVTRMNPTPGDVIALCHSQVYRVHRDRIRGFSDYLVEQIGHAPTFHFLGFSGDDGKRAVRIIREAATSWTGLTGIYNCGGGNSRLLDALRSEGKRYFFIGHELSDAAEKALEDGTADVIFDQRPEAQARRAVDIVLGQLGVVEMPVDNPPIRFTTVTRENL